MSTPASSRSSTSSSFMPQCPPPISFDPWAKKYSIISCTLSLLFFDLVLPCLLYYVLQYLTSLSAAGVLGIACLSLGLGELLELPFRAWRLYRYKDIYAPLGSTSKWTFDSLFWFYLLLNVIGVVSYVIATDTDAPILWLFLFTPGILIGSCALPLLITVFPFSLPLRISSDAAGERVKPAIYYIIEDFVAVDAGQSREFRKEWKARYDSSPIFQRMIRDLNLWWAFGCFVFAGALAGVTWGMEFVVAYGVSLALIFIFIGIWALLTWFWVRLSLKKERQWFEQTYTKQDIIV